MDPPDFLPAFVIGYETGRPIPDRAPLWLTAVQHQYGGGACDQLAVTGCVLRLSLNQREGTGKLWLLTRALVELGESWPRDAVYRAHEVDELRDRIVAMLGHFSNSRALVDVAAMDALLAEHVGFPGLVPPKVEAGAEALIRFLPSDPLPFFDRWRVACTCRWEHGEPDRMHECAVYDRAMQLALRQFVGDGAQPRIFLLWENSD